MKYVLGAIFSFTLAATANAGHGGGPELGRFGGDFGGRFDSFSGFGHGAELGIDVFGLGLGIGSVNTERQQDRFEQRFDTLQTQYENGVSDITDFFTTETYDRIVDRTESLVDRYGLFLSGVERNVDRLTDVIGIANDDLTYYNDLLADYQAEEDLSAARLAGIERSITRITDRLTDRIDFLTDTQTLLQENLPTYETFQTSLGTFLSDITAAAGGTTSDASGSLLAISANPSALSLMSKVSASDSSLCPPSGLGTSGAVPEPISSLLALSCLHVLLAGVRRRRN